MAGLAPHTNASATATAIPDAKKKDEVEKVDYCNLPCPIPYEEIHREALSECSFFLRKKKIPFSLFLCSSLLFCFIGYLLILHKM